MRIDASTDQVAHHAPHAVGLPLQRDSLSHLRPARVFGLEENLGVLSVGSARELRIETRRTGRPVERLPERPTRTGERFAPGRLVELLPELLARGGPGRVRGTLVGQEEP